MASFSVIYWTSSSPPRKHAAHGHEATPVDRNTSKA